MGSGHGYCANCKKYQIQNARSLCRPCYGWHFKRGLLELFPRKQWTNQELLEELDFWRAGGLSVREAAERMGVALTTVRRAVQRAKERARASGSLPETSGNTKSAE